MSITVEHAMSDVPVTILAIQGYLDASNYLDVIAKAKEIYEEGARYLLVDMGAVPFTASSGLVALHRITLLFRGEEFPDPDHAWDFFSAIDGDKERGVQERVKLLNPQPRVQETLEMTGLDGFFEIYTDREMAIASFR